MTLAKVDNASEEVFVFPASFAQQRLWFLDRLFPSNSFYNVPTAIRLSGILDLEALEASFDEIVCRHEILRTSFGIVEGQPVQLIAPHSKVSLSLLHLQQLPASERETAAQQAIAQEMQQPFNLERGSLLRVTLLQLDELEHVLVINVHHIIFDEWSIAILIRELGLLYTAFSTGQPSPMPELSIQYADFAHWQRQWLQGEVLESQLSYWRSQLQNLSPLEIDNRSRSDRQSKRGATELLELPKNLSDALLALSQQEGTTLFMTLLAAFQVLLYRYTGQTDIAIGSPISNRNRRELEDLIGFFANSLVLRTDLSGNPSFRELLSRVRQVAVEAYAHQDLPFEKLVEELHPERKGSRNPLFQVVFALQNAPIEQLALPKLTLSSFKVDVTTARFDLEFYLWECGENFRNFWGDGWQQSEGLRGVVVYNTDLFEPSAIARMLGHYQTLLTGVVADPDTNLADLPLLSAAEQHQLVEWNQTKRNYPDRLCIHQLFEIQVAQNPHAVAVNFGERQYTYQELNSGSNQLAHYLRKLGVGCETLVGICMEPSPMAIASLLGILKAGAAYVPLDPTYPPERLQFMLEDARVSVLLTQQALVPLFQGERGALAPLDKGDWGDLSKTDCREGNPVVVCLEQDWEAIAQQSEENPINQTTVDNLAYVVYTSGSTGTPKGVAVPHRAVNRLVCNTNYITLDARDKVAQCANVSFDAATFEIWGALLNGAQLVGFDREIMLSPQKFAQEMRQQEISVLFLTTALFNQMAREIPDCFRSLRYLLFGGEAVDVRWVKAVKQHGAPAHLLHVYGPTENTTFTSWYEVQDVPEAATSIPIGRAIANTQIYLLDADLKPVPIGVTGEIYTGGDGLARGYLNRPQLTAERFMYGSRGAEGQRGRGATTNYQLPITNYQLPITKRLYKTGDLARYLPDGNLEFVGRTDEQIKLRGFRIELGEIEMVLKQYPMEAAAIAVREDEVGDRRLVAYIVPNMERSPQPPFSRGANEVLPSEGGRGGIEAGANKFPPSQGGLGRIEAGANKFPPSQGGLGGIGASDNKEKFSTSNLRSFLKTKLPNYMIPSAFVVLEQLPLTPNGKVDRHALPSPDFASVELPPTLAPRTSVEAELVQIWTNVLGVQVGISDNFFELGGHSLLATQLVSRIRDRFGVEVPLRSLFETPTIMAMAQHIDAIRRTDRVQIADTQTISAQNREEVEF